MAWILAPRLVSGTPGSSGDFVSENHTGNVNITGSLTVTTLVAATAITTGDNLIVLNDDVVGAPSENAGLEVTRGASPNSQLLWNEATDRWQAGIIGSLKTLAFEEDLGTAAFQPASNFATAAQGALATTATQPGDNVSDLVNDAGYLTEATHDALPSDNPHGVTAAQVGLSNVDNTSDADKPVSTAQQAALDLKYDASNPSGFETPAQLNARDAANRDRANHTGTQTASTISDFDAEVSNNTSVVANTAKVSFPEAPSDGTPYVRQDAAWVSQPVGVTDHGALTGLADDDHTQYLTEARHDALPSDNPHGVTKAQVGLSNVDNTSDLAKPISTATQTALDGKANLAGGNTFTGNQDITGDLTIRDAGSSIPTFLDVNSNGSSLWSNNVSSSDVVQVNANSQWRLALSQVTDSFSIQRSAPGATWAPTTLLSVNNVGAITAPAYGTGAVTGTPTRALAVDAAGNVIERTLTPTKQFYFIFTNNGTSALPSVGSPFNFSAGFTATQASTTGAITRNANGTFTLTPGIYKLSGAIRGRDMPAGFGTDAFFITRWVVSSTGTPLGNETVTQATEYADDDVAPQSFAMGYVQVPSGTQTVELRLAFLAGSGNWSENRSFILIERVGDV